MNDHYIHYVYQNGKLEEVPPREPYVLRNGHYEMLTTSTTQTTGVGMVNVFYQEWQCDYCNRINLREQDMECRGCGAPRRVHGIC